MSFFVPWQSDLMDDGAVVYRPILDTLVVCVDGRMIRESFLVDSGADTSMAPRRLCDQLGYDWSLGSPITLRGIVPREECWVRAMIHPVDIFIREAGCRLTIPIGFAEIDVALLLGREVFFDAFRIQFDQSKLQTTFESV